ncbi:MAG: protein kinase [Deltaproteobacteria bacterium]|nr:protein kinase [Deltaproteobacteria bacterium]
MVASGERVFGKYEVLRRLAVGGMGEIFLSRQVGVVDRLVILKSLLPQLASDAQALASFLDEARILASINHPNVVALYEVGEWEDTQFIAMEFINGVDVSALLKFCEDNRKRLPPLVTAQIIREAAMGLDSAHTATDATGVPLRVVHRDISPHNIMVRSDGLAKVVDFGVAVADNRQQKTEAGLLKGKLGYMAPEQIKGAPVEPKADQFSLGVLLWEMLTQRRLFTGDNAAQVFMRILKEKVAAPSSLVADVAPELDAIVVRMTAQEPVDRFPRLGDAAMALRRVLEQYKSPDNAAANLIRVTVGPELAQRQKDLAVRPPASANPSAGFGPAAGSGLNAAPPSTPKVTCGVCGTTAPAGDRFCRSCGSSIGTGTGPVPGPRGSGTGGTPAVGTPGIKSGNTASIPRVDVMGASATSTGSVRRPADEHSNPFLIAPGTGSRTPAATPAPIQSAELAVVAGFVEILRHGQVLPADADARAAAFAVVDDLAVRHKVTALKNDNGRFSLAFVGEGATLTAVSLARGNVRSAARAGNDVLLRLAVASEPNAPVDQIARLHAMAEQLIDNAAPGSAVIADAARLKGGDPPTTRSASVTLRDGGSVIAHELQLPRRLIGRTAEIAALDAALDQVEREKKAAQIMLLGEGGVGKTALLEVVQTFARDRGFLTGFARGARVKEALALDVLRQLVKGVCLDVLVRERLTGAWSRAVDLCGLSPAYAARLKAIIDDEGDQALRDVPAARRRSVLKAAVLAFFEKLCDRAPVLLVVDDQHKGDAQSFEILAELGARLGSRRLAVIIAGRPMQGERVMPLAKRVNIGPLPAGDVTAIASQLLGCPVVDPLASLLVQRSLGNPLVLAILLRHLVAMQAIAPSPNGVQLLVDVERMLPPNPTVLIHANHALLPPEAQTLLLAAAHIGQVVEPASLFRVIEGVRDVVGVLRGLVDVGILEALPTAVGAQDQWSFKSTVELETIPARLDASQGRVLQQRVADALAKDLEGRFTLEAGERLASHLFAAEARQKAAEVSSRVAERAAGLGLFDVAAEHYKRALAVEWRAMSAGPGAEEKVTRVLKTAASACACLVEIDANAAVDVVAPVLKSCPPLMAVPARVEALRQRGLALARLKRFSDAESCLDEALETLASDPSPGIAAGLLVDLASVLEQRGDIDSAVHQLEEAVPKLASAGATSSLARERGYDAVLLLGRLRMRQRNFAPARVALLQALEEAKASHRAAAEAETRAMLGALCQAEGNLDQAVSETQQALLHAEGVGDPILEARLRQQLGRTLVALGRRGDAAVVLQQAYECARLGQWDEGASAAQQLLAVVGG